MFQSSIYFNDKIQVIPSGSKSWTVRKTNKKALYIKQQDRFNLNINQIQLFYFYQKRESYFEKQLFVNYNQFNNIKEYSNINQINFLKKFIEFSTLNVFQVNNSLAVQNNSSIVTSIENQFFNNRSIYLTSRFTGNFFQKISYYQQQSLLLYFLVSINNEGGNLSISKHYIDKGLSFFIPGVFGLSGSYHYDIFNQSNWQIRYSYTRKLSALSRYETAFNPYIESDFSFFVKLYVRKQSYKQINATAIGFSGQIASFSKFFRYISWIKGNNQTSIGYKGIFKKNTIFKKLKKIHNKSLYIKINTLSNFKKKVYLNKKSKKKFPSLFRRLQKSGFSIIDQSKSNYFSEYYNTVKSSIRSSEQGLSLINKKGFRRFNGYLRNATKNTKNRIRLRKYLLSTDQFKNIEGKEFQKNIEQNGRIYQINQVSTLSRIYKQKQIVRGNKPFYAKIPFGFNLFFRQKAVKAISNGKSFKNTKFAVTGIKKVVRFKNIKGIQTYSKIKDAYSFSRGFNPVKKRFFFSVQGQLNGLVNKRVYRKITPQTFGIKLKGNTSNSGIFSRRRFGQLKNLVLRRTATRITLHRINGISFTRFIFNQNSLAKLIKWHPDVSSSNNQLKSTILHKVVHELSQSGPFKQKIKTSSAFLSSIERERVSRFRYVAVYIQDLIRVTFFSIYIKKATFLASFFAFTLGKLPRNRKETTFLRFLIKLIKVFSTQRKEILGVRIRFQGRVNRWRRTKHIIGEKGVIPFYTYSSRIDYGSAQAITRKGAQGIKIWLCYQSSFSTDLKKAIYSYISVPKLIAVENKDAYTLKQQPFKLLKKDNKKTSPIFKYQQQFNKKKQKNIRI